MCNLFSLPDFNAINHIRAFLISLMMGPETLQAKVMDAKVNQNTRDVKDVKQQQTTSVAEQKTLKTTLQNLSKTVEKLQREKKDK